jgi:DNA modification methylase
VTPYYQDENVQLFLGDCREVLPTLPRASVDLICTDPPYGKHWQSGRRHTTHDRINGDDGTLDVPAALALAMPALRNRRHLYVFGPADLSRLPLGPQVELIWDKAIIGPGDLSLPWGPAHEPITFAVHVARPANRAAGDGRLAARLRRGSVIRVQRANAGQLEDAHDQHATPKPVELIRQLIESSSVRGETVLDPFAGAGPVLEAAVLEGRKAVGIELDERNCERIARRLALAQGVLTL